MPACASCGKENPEDARFCLACGSPLAIEEPEVRKVVTVLFSDVAGSTPLGERLDPETLRRVMARYFDEVRIALERYGGTVEKFIGDAVMAVFGIPVAHEDDALRAVRAAIEIRDRLAGLNETLAREHRLRIETRTGINTGEVVAGHGETLVTGDAVNVAARLEQVAEPGLILIGDSTYRLVKGAVRSELLDPLTVKGKESPVTAWRLLDVLPDAEAIPRRLETPLMGRADELARLTTVFDEARREAVCKVVTLVGEPGIGKSRLAGELTSRLGEHATVLRGRCLPYGEGITYWPLVEILRTAAHHEARARIVELLQGEPDADLIATRLASAVGGGEAGGTPEEIAWAARKLLERLARERPLVVVVDDLQWAEPTFLDLLEHVAYLARSPILLLALARTELLDTRPAWPGERVRLEPLTREESERLVSELAAGPIAPEIQSRILAAAAGNPLFLEQLLAIGSAEGHDFVVPPTIQALLAARLDRLGQDERAVIECASIVGQEFWDGAVRALRGDGSVGRPLLELVRQDLIEPHESAFADEDGFRFVHLLVRDAAYESLSKERRTELHERLAGWLERKDAERGFQHDEIVGYHLEQAHRYLRELGRDGRRASELAEAAADRLARAGLAATQRGDVPASTSLLRRAVDLLPVGSPRRTELLPALASALLSLGGPQAAEAVVAEAIEEGRRIGDRKTEWRSRLLLTRIESGRSVELPDRLERVASEAIDALSEVGDDGGVARAWLTLSQVHDAAGREGEARQAAENALRHARSANDRAIETLAMGHLWSQMLWGATPASELVTSATQQLAAARATGERTTELFWQRQLPRAYALVGRIDDARALAAAVRSAQEELGSADRVATMDWTIGEIELRAGDPARAEQAFRSAYAHFERVGDNSFLCTVAAELAHALFAQGKVAEAHAFSVVSERRAEPDDLTAQVPWRTARAKALAWEGRFEEAERLTSEALSLLDAAGADKPNDRAGVLMDLADIFQRAGRPEDARQCVEEAARLYEAKGTVPSLANARAMLEKLNEARESRAVPDPPRPAS